jgi:hypothetical protein
MSHTVNTNYIYMRTKALLGLAVLSASAACCMAQQNVYSLNIVGYVNVPIAGNNALTLLSNPLKPSNGNYNITNTIVLTDAQTDALIYKWAGTGWSSDVPQYFGAAAGWAPDLNINLGEAFFIQNPGTATSITFVGEVQTGDATTPIQYSVPAGTSFIAPKTPVVQDFPGGDVGHDNDQIYTWTGTAWSSDAWQYFVGAGWFSPSSTSTNGPSVPVGGGVVYANTGAALSWTRTFTP